MPTTKIEEAINFTYCFLTAIRNMKVKAVFLCPNTQRVPLKYIPSFFALQKLLLKCLNLSSQKHSNIMVTLRVGVVNIHRLSLISISFTRDL